MTNPLKLDTESLLKIKPFDVLLPRRYQFTLRNPNSFSVYFSDYRVFTENEEAARKRLK